MFSRLTHFVATMVIILTVVLAMTSCSKDPVGPESTIGNLIIESYPSGATITFDGKVQNQKTPDTLRDIEQGKYEIILKLDGYHTVIDSVTVKAKETVSYQQTLQRGYGAIQFISNPVNATVYIDNYKVSDRTPYVQEHLTVGQHRLKLTKSGYADWIDSANVLIDDTITVNAVMDTLLGWINVSSNPTGADIYINTATIPHSTPFTDSLPPGHYTLRAESNGYYTAHKNINVTAFDTLDVNIEMELITGGIKITTNPKGAQIFLDALPTGEVSPAIIKAVPGNHSFSLRKAGYYDIDTTLLVIADNTLNLDVTLKTKPTSMNITSSPSGAEIFINGSTSGYTTPHTFYDISPGNYTLRLTLSGYLPMDSVFYAQLGMDNHWDVNFRVAPDLPFAYTVGSRILMANADGIITDTLSLEYDDWIASYVSYQGEIRWSPNGQYLAFSGDHYPVSIVDQNGNWLRGFGGNRSMDFAWSPNSNELVWGVYCGGLCKNVISTNWYGHISYGCYDNSPAYRPDGKKIMFMYHNWGTSCRIDLCNTNGSNRQNIYGWFGAGFDEHNQVVWATDSTALFKIGGKGIWEVLIPDSGKVTLTKRVSDRVSRFRISANREWVAYKTSSGIYHMQVGVWSPVRISDLKCYDFAITNDGEFVLCRTGNGVHIVDRQGNSYHVINHPSAGRGAIDIKP